MKNKPSLYDIETFIKDRDLELEAEQSRIEKESQSFDQMEAHPPTSNFQKLIDTQKKDIDRINSELEKSNNLHKTYKELLKKQQKEINALKKELGSNSKRKISGKNKSEESYNLELILNNVVMLIDEKYFSNNDVVRLFRAEGFPPPDPHTRWDTKVIDALYQTAKKRNK